MDDLKTLFETVTNVIFKQAVKIFIGLSILLPVFGGEELKAQEVHEQIFELINKSDWFTLEETYPHLKDKIEVVALKEFAEALIAVHFNRPEIALRMIDSLIQNYQEEIGLKNVSALVAFKSSIMGDLGFYAQSADFTNDFLSQVTEFAKEMDFSIHRFLFDLYNAIRDEPAPEIIRPAHDTELPLTFEKAGKVVHMFLPVTVHGKEYPFMFDTGANTTFVSERFANETGLRIVRDSVAISGIETCTGKIGTIDSLIIGDIVFKNPVIVILPPVQAIDTIYRLDAILGRDFIQRTGEVRIYPRQNKICFPENRTPLPATGRNLMLSMRDYYAKLLSDKEKLVFHFDTGSGSSNLYNRYYEKHKELVDLQGVNDSIKVGGICGIRYLNTYRLPSIDLTMGNVPFGLSEIHISTEDILNSQQDVDGSLGMDFIRLFEKVTVNFDEMFVAVEK
jgi:hypothetical protein